MGFGTDLWLMTSGIIYSSSTSKLRVEKLDNYFSKKEIPISYLGVKMSCFDIYIPR